MVVYEQSEEQRAAEASITFWYALSSQFIAAVSLNLLIFSIPSV